MTITRIVVTAYGLLFAALGVGLWIAPEPLAARLAIAPIGVPGLSAIRGDLGGMFVVLSALCLVGVWSRRRSLLVVAALALCAVVTGRLISLAATGSPAGLALALPVEVGAIVALALHARSMGRPADPAPKTLGAVLVLFLLVAVLVAAGAAALRAPQVQDRLFAWAAQTLVAQDNAALLGDDALRVALCGTSSPLPSNRRAKACVAVMAGGKMYIVDSGPESTERLMQWGVPLDRVAGVFLTHFHSDHIGDLPELNLQTWVAGRPGPLAVYGGPGVEQVVAGFNTALAQDQAYRTAHHTARMLPPQTAPMQARPVAMTGPQPHRAVVYDDGAMRITAIETNHAPVSPAYAYRFDYRGRSVVITGDTTADPRLVEAARGADILFSEALNRDMVRALEGVARRNGRDRVAHIMADIQSYHISPEEAADTANRASVKLLVLYHLIPAPDNFVLRGIFTRRMNEARKGDWRLSDDGSLYTLPVGSKAYEAGRVPHLAL